MQQKQRYSNVLFLFLVKTCRPTMQLYVRELRFVCLSNYKVVVFLNFQTSALIDADSSDMT